MIDLGAIDADKNTAGDQAFRFGGRDGAPEAREVSWFRGGADVVVAFNDGRRVTQIELAGRGRLSPLSGGQGGGGPSCVPCGIAGRAISYTSEPVAHIEISVGTDMPEARRIAGAARRAVTPSAAGAARSQASAQT